ncbi:MULTISPECIES: hypothetical protein [Myxococcus]|uniref:hypothetical protein n=1 Tax=Myxococcus TaxID=32 RepID=UPI00114357E2|nr:MULTISPECIES: hypothetical protein [Myxococcus]NOK06215.1 hypothetical protein [Myxococcus xanthus]
MAEYPECPKCEQRALYPRDVERPPVHDCPDCECSSYSSEEPEVRITCAACGHVVKKPSTKLLGDAADALDANHHGDGTAFARIWTKKLADERAKVARLSEGRW